jgi:hypothetical protein
MLFYHNPPKMLNPTVTLPHHPVQSRTKAARFQTPYPYGLPLKIETSERFKR